MKKTNISEKGIALTRKQRTEYHFDYRKAKPNRFASQPEEDRVVVVLDPDVSEVFQTPDSVNEVLRALIKTMPSRRKRAEAKSRRARTGP